MTATVEEAFEDFIDNGEHEKEYELGNIYIEFTKLSTNRIQVSKKIKEEAGISYTQLWLDVAYLEDVSEKHSLSVEWIGDSGNLGIVRKDGVWILSLHHGDIYVMRDKKYAKILSELLELYDFGD